MFKLFEHSKYMIIYKIGNLWNLDSFPNWKISKICYFSKTNNFKNLMIFEIGKCLKFSKLKYFLFNWKTKIRLKNWQFRSYSFMRYSALLAIFSILIFSIRYKSIFSIFMSYFMTRSSADLNLNVY